MLYVEIFLTRQLYIYPSICEGPILISDCCIDGCVLFKEKKKISRSKHKLTGGEGGGSGDRIMIATALSMEPHL